MKTILILEDNEERVAGFRKAVSSLGPQFNLKIWRSASAMCQECDAYFSETVLISLDHDLNPLPGETVDPGTGVDVARFLGDFMPVCPVLIHSSNTDRVYSMHNELRFAGWTVDRVGPIGEGWIESSWLPLVRRMLTENGNTWRVDLPPDHAERVERMKSSLDGLAIGDALGEMLSYRSETAAARLATNDLPAGPWFHTDDTEMALSIAATLKAHGCVNQDALARRFSRRFEREPDRGYGRMTRIQMQQILAGAHWRDTAANAFGGQGSMGNGSAMRVAPLGAYFADDPERCASEAKLSSTTTHTHPEGIAGAIAVAIAAAMAWKMKGSEVPNRSKAFFEGILFHTPESRVRRGILLASTIPPASPRLDVARSLGNGSLVTAPDTVPFCLWVAAHHLDHFEQALGTAISCGGDCDTNAAIVGGIVALSTGREGIPVEWLKAREQIKI